MTGHLHIDFVQAQFNSYYRLATLHKCFFHKPMSYTYNGPPCSAFRICPILYKITCLPLLKLLSTQDSVVSGECSATPTASGIQERYNGHALTLVANQLFSLCSPGFLLSRILMYPLHLLFLSLSTFDALIRSSLGTKTKQQTDRHTYIHRAMHTSVCHF